MSLGHITLRAGDILWEFAGVDNFVRLSEDALFANSLRVTAVFTISAVALTVVLGTVLAFAVDRMVRQAQWLQNILLWPAIVTPVVISVVWLLLLSPQIGLVNKVLGSLGLPTQTWLGEPTGALVSIILVDVWHWTPVVFLFIYTALRGIDSSIVEAASVDGATYWQRVRHILLPLLTPALIGVTAIRVIMSVKAFDEMYLLTFGGPGNATTVITIYLRSVFFESFEYGYGAALSVTVVLLVVVSLTVTLGGRSLLRRNSRG
jgi:multiple sugar transport system permease protein